MGMGGCDGEAGVGCGGESGGGCAAGPGGPGCGGGGGGGEGGAWAGISGMLTSLDTSVGGGRGEVVLGNGMAGAMVWGEVLTFSQIFSSSSCCWWLRLASLIS